MAITTARRLSQRSQVRAWTFYTALGYVAITVTVVGLTLQELATSMSLPSPLSLHSVFLGRFVGALCGTILGGWLCDVMPIKLLMSSCIVLSATSLCLLPHVAVDLGFAALLVNFGLLGIAGAALVCCATTAACWAFPGKAVGPILSGCAGAFGITSAMLPAILWPWPVHGNVDAEYAVAAACALPALALVVLIEAPPKPERHNNDAQERSAGSAEERQQTIVRDWSLAIIASMAQMLLQGANASMLVWLVSFGQLHVHLTLNAKWLISVLQGAVTLGSVAAMYYQSAFELLDLACVQLLFVVAGVVVWLSVDSSRLAASVVAVAWYGFVGGPTLGYCSALFNQYTTPSGKQMAMINLGSNCGVGLAPYVTGLLMERCGPLALLWIVVLSNGVVFVGMTVLRLYIWRSHGSYTKVVAAREICSGSEQGGPGVGKHAPLLSGRDKDTMSVSRPDSPL